eukprot:14883209-Heterocapsa_arctica.AAC.1
MAPPAVPSTPGPSAPPVLHAQGSTAPPAMMPPPGPPPAAPHAPAPTAPLQLLTSSKAPALPRALPAAPTEE